MSVNIKKHGTYALVTGASSGIGEEFARQLAARGFSLVLVARRRSRLDALAAELRSAHNVDVRAIDLDLLRDDAVDVLVDKIRGLEVGLGILNAGIFTCGPFVENTLSAEIDVVRLNVVRPMQLAHRLGAEMAQRGRGGLILVSSTAGHQGVPFLANYAATKAYVLALGQALHYELARSHVDVTVLSPGTTRTEGVTNAEGIDFFRLPVPVMQPSSVVKAALAGLGRKAVVVPGIVNRFMDAIGKYATPRALQTKMFGMLVGRALSKPALGAARRPALPESGQSRT